MKVYKWKRWHDFIFFWFMLMAVSAVTLAAGYCYEPYSTAVVTEFEAEQALVIIHWTDTGRGGDAASTLYYDEDTLTSICEVWVHKPEQILGDPDMDALGHEVLHCLVGDFHPED